MSQSVFQIVPAADLMPLLDRQQVITAVREALIWQAEGKVQSPLPGQLLFDEPHGDCHIKYGHVQGGKTFAIKVATGFYENPKLGLPSNNGLVLVMDAQTGMPKLLFQDEGWLTAWRTAAAVAIAAAALAPERVEAIGILGTGLQAELSMDWLPETVGERPFLIWGRNPDKAAKLAEKQSANGHKVQAVTSIEDLLQRCNLVVTATPSTEPLFSADSVRSGTHLVAMGADSPGKQELPAELFAKASHILTDDHAQCLDHGDFGNGVRAGFVAADADVMLGDFLAGRQTAVRQPDDITIADLTGIAAEDIAIADLFSSLLSR